ncbi:MAG: parvulin peptidyl-prolyl isomerase [Desulfobacula sp.]|nr:parvulin peptidyl-prolyl isomerase [Desulfobacula sp.]
MIKNNRIVLLLLTMGLIFCGSPSAEVVDKIVAIVDNDIITLVQLNMGTANYRKQIDAGSYSEDQKKIMIKDVNENILNNLIDQSLTHQEAQKYRIAVSENEINRSMENVMRSNAWSREEFEKALEREGLTMEDYRNNLKKQILQTKIINHSVKSKVVIMESDMELYYKNHKGKYSGEIKHHLRNIIVNNRDKLEKIRQQLDGEKDFTSLAKKYSIASNAKDGGDLGTFEIKNFPDNIKDEILKLKKGQYSNVISTPQGFQIFYVEDIIFKGGKTFEQAHDEIHEVLYNKQVEIKFKTWLESLKQKAHIKIML